MTFGSEAHWTLGTIPRRMTGRTEPTGKVADITEAMLSSYYPGSNLGHIFDIPELMIPLSTERLVDQPFNKQYPLHEQECRLATDPLMPDFGTAVMIMPREGGRLSFKARATEFLLTLT